jgi:molecular chaperone GrpE
MSNTQEQELESQNNQNETTQAAESSDAGREESAEASMEESEDSSNNDKIAAELQEYKDKFVRLFAEFENFRRRSAKENFEVMANANAKLLGKLTDVLDNFNLAFDPKNKAGSAEDIEKGIRLIYNKFKDILSDEGLTEVDPVGEAFDPNIHEALMQQPSDTVPENQIIQVLQKGYKAKNKILKHAKVIVSTGKP